MLLHRSPLHLFAPLLLLLPALLFTACVETPELTASLEDDTILAPEEGDIAAHLQELQQTQVVFVNFDGVTVRSCPTQAYCSDARINRSRIIESFFDRDSITWRPYTNTAGRNLIMAELREAFAPYDVQFTTSRPSSGDYTMLVIATNSEFSGLGVAPLDCNNRWRNDIAFVYRANDFDARTIANAAVHELGHSFGLSHVEAQTDYMFFQANALKNLFTRSRYDLPNAPNRCTSGTHQDSPELLFEVLGPRPFDGHFADDDGNVHEAAIDAIYEAGITSGCEGGHRPRFCPDDDVLRGQMAVFLHRALDLPPATRHYFDDTVGTWYADQANRLAEAGITTGCAERRFCGNQPVTRAHMAVFLARAFDLPPATQNYFDDTAGTYYADAANRLAEAGITSGCGHRRYCGQSNVTRGQMASFLARALGLI